MIKTSLLTPLGYRRYGYNEETSPVCHATLFYTKNENHPDVRQLYVEKLIGEAPITPEDADRMEKEVALHSRRAPRQAQPE
ncbi:MAG: hypothetical protein IPH20_25120 [Bacteroidales bacterium]|nr:hypothetical protein [Bacteroidales bacterium]